MGLSNNLGKLSNMITSTGSAVGIGTTSPNFILDVKQATNQHFYVGAGISVSGAIVLGGGNDAANANIPIEMRYATSFAFVDGGNDRMRISGSNVGIGTITPTDNIIGSGTFLDISSSTGGALKLHFTPSATYGEFSLYKGSNGSYIDSAGAATLANNDLIFRTGGAASNFGVTERFRIANTGTATFSGEVVVGSPTTNATLSISGDNSGGDSFLNFRADGGGIKAQIQGTKFAGTGGQILFKTRINDVLTESMRINQIGSVLLPKGQLEFSGTNGGVELGTTVGIVKYDANNVVFYFGTGNLIFKTNSGAIGDIVFFNQDGTIRFAKYTSNGTLTTTSSNGTIAVSSDKNMKIDAGFVENGLEKVLSLKPRYFYWKDEEKFGNKKQLGFYAQEVNEISEEASNTPEEGQGWGIYDRALIAILTKAVQELSAQNQDLKSRLDKAGL